MPSPEQFTEHLLTIPEIRGLKACAERSRTRFAIRGGILRNLLLRFEESHHSSLYDFVDPFSDIDLIVEQDSDWPHLAQAIAESIPFAGFHRWEVATEEAIRAAARRFGMIQVDRLVLWFDGKTEKHAKVFVRGLDIKHEDILENPTINVEHEWGDKHQQASSFGQLLDALRVARYAFAFPTIRSAIKPGELLERLRFDTAPNRQVDSRQVSVDIRRLELAILDLLFTAAHWPEVSTFLDLCRKAISPWWLENSPLLRRIFYQSALTAGTGIGVVLYKPGPASILHTVLFNDSHPVPVSLRGIDNIIPWVRLLSSGHNPRDCCNYTDFQNGVASIAWRGKQADSDFSKLDESQVAAVASVTSAVSYAGPKFRREQGLMSIPGFVRKGRTIVMRVDHGYVRSFLNRNALFHLGLISSRSE